MTEEDLLGIYEDVLALPPTAPELQSQGSLRQPSHYEVDAAIVHTVASRLPPLPASQSPPLSRFLRSRHTQLTALPGPIAIEEYASAHRRVITHLERVAERIETVDAAPPHLALGLLAPSEWAALVRVCIYEKDYDAAERATLVMQRVGADADVSVNVILEEYANLGNVARFEAFLGRSLQDSPSPHRIDQHIKVHLRAAPPHAFPTRALALAHNYETHGHLPALQTYTRLIAALLAAPTPTAHAHAFDLFAHMRYVAHPTPDAFLYALMLRACASSPVVAAEPERALDLWTEMTVDKGIAPTAHAYDAVILALARAGGRSYVAEAFRLARQMLDAHRDARGRSAFRPGRRTFAALLEGAKRVGDLARARWILAEMVRGVAGDGVEGAEDLFVDEAIMLHVFHAYAAYKPPFRRSAVKQSAEAATEDSHVPAESSDEVSDGSTGDGGLPTALEAPSFSQIPPQTRSEVVGEARALFARVLADTGASPHAQSRESQFLVDGKFSRVVLTPRLLNAYLAVFYAHAPIQSGRTLFVEVAALGVGRNERSYVEALERCSHARKEERHVAAEWAAELWAEWEVMETRGREEGKPLSARMVERAHTAMIRISTLLRNLPRAVEQLKNFVRRYPPSDVRAAPIKPAFRSTRTSLVGERPLVRMIPSTDIPDDGVPPLLLFRDLEILHHRLVAAGSTQRDAIGYVKYVCKAYEGSLRMRRINTLRAEPESRDRPAA
ncbi:hypothetical protein PLICRDRAFT_58314 [Plicaturopsis crispa FD-325 SS-3]|uniref:Pentacotripeptide-repeat region of PRORP domain-containing protein n=1 Tax=Plicaturopsis crispa FD-325 SS-3 TaxID=944288 RepID=A0A0C9SQD1_PLICR|nr:hypothetical protein PLICRDRAFT_58314 [Plicaturopsis crispa FD-325 SS-3]